MSKKKFKKKFVEFAVEDESTLHATAESDNTEELVTLETRANKIRHLQADVQRGFFEIGRELIEAKKQVGHGGWGAWLEKEFAWTQRTANRLMAITERFSKMDNVVEYGPARLQTMLSLIEGKEGDFIEAQIASGRPIEKQSVRELQTNVKEWNRHLEHTSVDKPTEEQIDSEDEHTVNSTEEIIVEDKVIKFNTDSLEEVVDNEKVTSEIKAVSEEANVSDSLSGTIIESNSESTSSSIDENDIKSELSAESDEQLYVDSTIDSFEQDDTLSMQTTENAAPVIHKTRLEQPFVFKDFRRIMEKQLNSIDKFISSSENLDDMKELIACLEELRKTFFEKIRFADNRLHKLEHDALNSK